MADTVLARRDDGLELDADPRRVDLVQLHQWLSEDAYWARERPAELVARSVRNSTVVGAYDADRMVAFARAVTDGTTFAWLCDVYVAPNARGRGVAKWMVGALVRHLERSGVTRVVLRTRDAHGLYRGLGFGDLSDPDRWMERRGGHIEAPAPTTPEPTSDRSALPMKAL